LAVCDAGDSGVFFGEQMALFAGGVAA